MTDPSQPRPPQPEPLTPKDALASALRAVTFVGPEHRPGRGLDPRSYTAHQLDSHFTDDPCDVCAALGGATTPDLDAEVAACLAELSESPLPGARYAYSVVKRRFARLTPEATVATAIAELPDVDDVLAGYATIDDRDGGKLER